MERCDIYEFNIQEDSMYWTAMSQEEIGKRITQALNKNQNYSDFNARVMGYPGSFLDTRIFPALTTEDEHSPIIPYLQVLRENPNHIGCHTTSKSEGAFKGTQEIEVELLTLCAEQILAADPNSWDGYVASGGTEANIQAMWVFRNAWVRKGLDNTRKLNKKEKRKKIRGLIDQLHVITSIDTHYSIDKGANILNLSYSRIPVSDELDRQMNLVKLQGEIEELKSEGVKKFLVVLNMGSTHYGSVDDINQISRHLDSMGVDYEIHIDAAFGGFIYPFTNEDNRLNFKHSKVSSITLDAHKMLQAPYGTGIFLSRKGFIENVDTEAASYVPGHDQTVCGSRSGANAVSVWMILRAYGSEDGKKFCKNLVKRTDFLCNGLKELNVEYSRNKYMNLVAIRAKDIPVYVANKYHLVPDDTESNKPKWYKCVVMDHVGEEMIQEFLGEIRNNKKHVNV